MTKRSLSLLAIALLLCTSIFAQKKSQKEKMFEGIWQICTTSSGDYLEISTRPFMKILSSDKTFTNVLLDVGDNRKSSVLSSGTYKITSDSTYTEAIQSSVSTPFTKGTQNKIQFKFLNDNLIWLRFQIPESGQWCEEQWIRIVQP